MAVEKVSAHDLARYLAREQEGCSPWRLHKLLYYCQAWHLVWEEQPIFSQPIMAWANGPVLASIYPVHRGSFDAITSWPLGRITKLSAGQRESADKIIEFYSKFGNWELQELVQHEKPWQDARQGVPQFERGNKRIKLESLYEYYSSL